MNAENPAETRDEDAGGWNPTGKRIVRATSRCGAAAGVGAGLCTRPRIAWTASETIITDVVNGEEKKFAINSTTVADGGNE